MIDFREEYERPHGLRFWRGHVSLKLRGYAITKHLDPTQMLALADQMHRFSDTLRAAEMLEAGTDDLLLGPSAFPALRQPRFFKCVSLEVWNDYLSRGTIQLGSAPYYRAIQNVAARDRHEGFCQIAFTSGKSQMHWHVEAGANALLLCGTRDQDTAYSLRARFGEVVVEIVQFPVFVERLARELDATSSTVRDVVYTNTKLYSLKQDFAKAREVLTGPRDTPEAMSALNKAFFEPLYMQASIVGLNSKPRVFSAERERRVVFEMPADLGSTARRIVDASALAAHFRRIV